MLVHSFLQCYNPLTFWISMADAFYQSLICFFIPYLVSHIVPFQLYKSQSRIGSVYMISQSSSDFPDTLEAPNRWPVNYIQPKVSKKSELFIYFTFCQLLKARKLYHYTGPLLPHGRNPELTHRLFRWSPQPLWPSSLTVSSLSTEDIHIYNP